MENTDELTKTLQELRTRIENLEAKVEEIKALEHKDEPTEWWVITRQDNDYPTLVYENQEMAKKVSGRDPVRVVPALPEDNEENCWAIVITDRYTRGTSLIYDTVDRAKMYAEYNRGYVLKVKKT